MKIDFNWFHHGEVTNVEIHLKKKEKNIQAIKYRNKFIMLNKNLKNKKKIKRIKQTVNIN